MNVKTILTIIGAIAVGVIGVLFGRSTKRGRVPGVRANLDTLGDSVGRATTLNNELGEALELSRDSAKEIRDRNRDSEDDHKRATEILRSARERSNQDNGDS